MEEMLQLGQHCSTRSSAAPTKTRSVRLAEGDSQQRRSGGQHLSGVIASVTVLWLLCPPERSVYRWSAHVSSPDNDYYRFDQVGQRLIGESGGQTYRLGDRVEVRVEAVNMDERKIDFSLISSERAPRNVGKNAREKAKKSTLANRWPSPP